MSQLHVRNLLKMTIGRDFVRCKCAYVCSRWHLHIGAKHVFITCRTHWLHFLFMVNYVVQWLTNLAVSHDHNNLAREHKASWYNQLPCYTLPPTQHHSFYRNLPPLAREKFVFSETSARNPIFWQFHYWSLSSIKQVAHDFFTSRSMSFIILLI